MCPEGSVFLFDRWAWMGRRSEQTGSKPDGWSKGWGPVPAKVTLDSWSHERRQAWLDRQRERLARAG
jgi:hypothetical protein